MPALGLKMRLDRFTAKIAAVVETGLAMWHKFTASTWTGSNRLPDSSGISNSAALYTGRGLSFDGVNDVVDIGSTGVTVRSVVFYGYPDTTTQKFMQFQASGAIDLGISSGTLTTTGWTSPTTYVNGAASSTVAATTWQQIACTSATGFTASAVKLGLSNATYYSGDLSNVKFFSVELSAAQVAELYANPEQVLPTGVSSAELVGWWPLGEGAGNLAFSGTSTQTGVISGATALSALPSPVTQPGVTSQGRPMRFDGSDDWVDCTNTPGDYTDNFTIMVWAASNAVAQQTLVARRSNLLTQYQFYLTSTGTLAFWTGVSYIGATNQLDGKMRCWAVVINGANSKLYANGTPSDTFSPTITSLAVEFRIGNYVSGQHWQGMIANTAIWNTALTDAEISALFSAGIGHNPNTSTGSYTSTGSLVERWVNNSATTWTNEVSSNHGTVNGSPATVYLPEGTTSGKDIFGMTTTRPNTGELILHGSGYALVADDATLDITTNLSLEAWVKPFSVSAAQTIIGKNTAYALKITSGAKPSFSKWTSSSETATDTTSTTVTANVWTHLAATYDGTNVRIYINGALDTTTAVSGAIDSTSTDVLLGALTTSTEQFNGYLDSCKVYNVVLTDAQVLENYTAELAAHS